MPCKQAWVLPRFRYLLLDMARQKGPLEYPEGPQPPGWGKELKVKSTKAAMGSGWAQ